MKVAEYALFPTRLVLVEFPDVAGLNEELYQLFTARGELPPGFNMHPDALNLLALADRCPAIGRLRGMFQEGLRRWLAAEQVRGTFGVEAVLFSNLAARGEMTLAHNHNADVAAVYYVQAPEHDRPPLFVPDPEGEYSYFEAEDGALVLHDPRFNANLAAVRVGDYAKVFPRPGLMVLFPGYLWHSVTPNQGERPRLSIAANFRLKWEAQSNAEVWRMNVEGPPPLAPQARSASDGARQGARGEGLAPTSPKRKRRGQTRGQG